MSDCLNQSQISALAAGAIDPAERARCMAHVESCVSCRVRLDSAGSASQRHAPTAEQPSPPPAPPSGPDVVSRAVFRAAMDAGGGPRDPHDDLSALMRHEHAASGERPLPQIPGYDVLDEIHRGGQGIVYKAVQKSTKRMVAVKVLPHELTASDRQKQRFEREVSLVASLRHPNIVTIYDSGLMSGQYYFAMEYIHGQPVDDWLRSRSLGVHEKLALFATICSAVAHAHQNGVVHRDLKPANIVVDQRGEPHVLDFGLAKTAGTAMLEGSGPLTMTSHFMGTLTYASPEQTMGDPSLIGVRSDVYALGVILFEMLTGTYPYPVSNDAVKMFKTIRETPPRNPSELARGLTADINTVTLRALAKEPERRYQTVADLEQDVRRLLAGEPIWARRDSVAYVLRTRLRRGIWRNPIAAMIAVTLIATAAAFYVGGFVFDRWNAPIRWFERVVAVQLAPAPSPAGMMESVRIITMDQATRTQAQAIAAANGVEGITPGNWQSMRRLHGRLMERLAKANVRGVVWDIRFPPNDGKPTEFDADFARGVEAIKRADAGKPAGGVAVGINAEGTWKPSPDGPADLSPVIRDAGVRWGTTVVLTDDSGSPWKPHLIMRYGVAGPVLSLGLAGFSVNQHPTGDVVAQFDEDARSVQLMYVDHGRGVMQSPASSESDVVALSHTMETVDDKSVGTIKGGRVGMIVLQLPDDAVLRAATRTYGEAWSMDDAALRDWCGGRIIVVGDFVSDPELHKTPDGRTLYGVFGMATTIDQLLRQATPIRYVWHWSYLGAIACGAALGVLIAWFAGRSAGGGTGRLLAGLAVGLTVLCAGSVAWFRLEGVLCNPFVPALAMLAAAAMSVLVARGSAGAAGAVSGRSDFA